MSHDFQKSFRGENNQRQIRQNPHTASARERERKMIAPQTFIVPSSSKARLGANTWPRSFERKTSINEVNPRRRVHSILRLYQTQSELEIPLCTEFNERTRLYRRPCRDAALGTPAHTHMRTGTCYPCNCVSVRIQKRLRNRTAARAR